MKKTFSLAASIFSLALWAAVPENVENPVFDPAKPPIIDEAKPLDTHSAQEWKNAVTKLPKCVGSTAWSVQDKGLVEATATKEKTVGVKGKFTRFALCADEKKGLIEGKGILDLSSWDSGLPPRDFRILKYVFGTEEKGQTVVPFDFHAPLKDAAAKESVVPLTLSFKFRGTPAQLAFKAKVSKEGNQLKIHSVEGVPYSFLTAARMASFGKLMELCNHHFLASHAAVAFDVTLDKSSK